MLRTVLRDSGGIRVDHIIGLFRLWWVPQGHPASEGTYVRYDHEALIGTVRNVGYRFVLPPQEGSVDRETSDA